ncbi:sugar phosphate isomerase/epimerase [Kribbella antibiotica]|uniref:Sugar phosphate isomerase/epimerase n=1 Tax=Kribbella antibiotica TaxID=190195 RepID=A0A4R4ZZ21_9ACTN|nr:sugar phosphate isomerase/epimerase [Kribbella antibiotica]TDD63409.1 sugar phosphate isomerase/epimerase [Kribbella antibiotica]
MATPRAEHLAPIALQMWTLHEAASQDLLGVLSEVAAIGYVGVETYDLYGQAPKAVRARLAELGLELCSSHAPFPAGERATEILDQYAELGAGTLVWSLEPAEFASVDGIRRGAERINEAVANAASYGLRIGYHNHFAEFRNAFDGRSAYEILLAELDPAVVLELDTYWAQTGGADPAALAASLGDRLEYIHLKDGPAQGMDDQMVPYGEGVVDIDEVVRANPAVRWNLVEIDRSEREISWLLRDCNDYLVGRGLGSGKVAA